MAEMETTREEHATKRRRLSLAGSSGQAACDLAVTNKAEPLNAHAELHSLLCQVTMSGRL